MDPDADPVTGHTPGRTPTVSFTGLEVYEAEDALTVQDTGSQAPESIPRTPPGRRTPRPFPESPGRQHQSEDGVTESTP